MSCVECLKNCNGTITPDKCIEYTGSDIELLGICNGDSLFQIETIILDTLLTLMDGTGITIEGLNLTCPLITGIQSTQDTTVPILFQTMISAICNLQGQVTTLQAQVDSGYSFDIDCLVGITPTSSRDQILQSVIHKVCDVDSRVTAIEADYVKASELCTLVDACLAGGGPTPVTDFNLRMVPYAVIPYIGSLSNFDNTGKGLVSTGFDKIYLMNGLNGTQDWRGRSPIGAIQNVPGGVLDSAVDPTLPANVGTNYVLNQKIGASSVSLLLAQMPAHTHHIFDPGHKHVISNLNDQDGRQAGPSTENFYRTLSGNTDTNTSTTGITLGSAGGGLSHTNLQPSVGTYYITYIP